MTGTVESLRRYPVKSMLGESVAESLVTERGLAADRRLALVPVADCTALQNSQKAPIQSWACVLMLHPMEKGGSKSGLKGAIYLEYRGDATDPSTPCATQGIPGSTSAGIGPMVPVLVQ